MSTLNHWALFQLRVETLLYFFLQWLIEITSYFYTNYLNANNLEQLVSTARPSKCYHRYTQWWLIQFQNPESSCFKCCSCRFIARWDLFWGDMARVGSCYQSQVTSLNGPLVEGPRLQHSTRSDSECSRVGVWPCGECQCQLVQSVWLWRMNPGLSVAVASGCPTWLKP